MALYHAFSEVENSNTGVPMRGVQVIPVFSGTGDPGKGVPAPIYADENYTPFSPSNYTVTDSTGMYSFYIEPGEYDLDFFIGSKFIRRIPDYRPAEVGPAGQSGPANSTYISTAALEGADTTNVSAILSEAGKQGTFTVRPYADFTAQVAADTGKVNYIRSTSDNSLVWVRAASSERDNISLAEAVIAIPLGMTFISLEVTAENPNGYRRQYVRTLAPPGYALTADQPVSKNALAAPTGAALIGNEDGGNLKDKLAPDISLSGIPGSGTARVVAATAKVKSSLLPQINGGNGLFLSKTGKTLDLSGDYEFSETLVLYPGVEPYLPRGSVLKWVGPLGGKMARSATPAEMAALGIPAYGSAALKFVGGGLLDGNGRASVGLQADTISTGSEIDIGIVGCTYRKFTTTCTFAAGSLTGTVSDPTGIQPLDILHCPSSANKFAVVRSIIGNNVTLALSGFGSAVVNAPVTHRAVGISAHMAQQSDIKATSMFNDIGMFLGPNTDGFGSGDLNLYGHLEFNMIGQLLVGAGGTQHDLTNQHNYEQDIVQIGGNLGNVWISPYMEMLSDSQYDTRIPPVGGAPVTAAAIRAKSMVDIISGNAIFRDIFYPANSSVTSYRDLFRNSGGTVLIDGINFGGGTVLSQAGAGGTKWGFIQDAPNGVMRVLRVTGAPNGSAMVGALITQADGTPALDYQASWSIGTSGNPFEVKSGQRWGNRFGSYILGFCRINGDTPDAQNGFQILPDGCVFGLGGAVAPDVTVKRGAAGANLTINGSYIRKSVGAPATSTSAGVPGDFWVSGVVEGRYTGDGTTHSHTILGFPTAITTSMNDAANVVNTFPRKVAGICVFNTTLNKPLWATGSATTSTWVDATGAVVITPA